MQLEPNMYVRTKTGIKQIYTIDNNKTKYKYLYKLKKQDGDGCIDCGALSSEDILKASHSLLGDDKEKGIIEIGDYVNGYKVIDFIYCGGGFTNRRKQGVKVDGEIWAFDYDEIKSIVTKEQMKEMQYKVV